MKKHPDERRQTHDRRNHHAVLHGVLNAIADGLRVRVDHSNRHGAHHIPASAVPEMVRTVGHGVVLGLIGAPIMAAPALGSITENPLTARRIPDFRAFRRSGRESGSRGLLVPPDLIDEVECVSEEQLSFSAIGVPDRILRNLERLGYRRPRPIQAEVLRPAI